MSTTEQKSNPLKLLLQKQSQAKSSAFFRRRRWWLLAALLLIALGVGLYGVGGSAPKINYITEEAILGPITVSVSASGTLNPTSAVDVGSELSGTLEAVLVRENDQVTKGQLLARLDTSKLRDSELKSQAAVTAAEAKVAQMEATLAESQASLARMRQVAELSNGKVPAKTELDTAEAAFKRAEANLKSALAEVAQTRASLKTDQTNIRKAMIMSPVDGVVLARKVEPGQTVAASMNAPILFNIAEDLTQMELHVNVDEADVAQVESGQKANFTVSAWNNRKFPASVERVNLGSTLTDNVVTYTTVLNVSNDDLALRPGMTASAEIVTAQRDNALLVPNAALRFSPARNGSPPRNGAGGPPGGGANAQGGSFLSRLMPVPQRRQPQQRGGAGGGRRDGNGENPRARVWVLENGQPRPVSFQSGVSNSRYTEVLEGSELKPGMAIITDYQEVGK
jgi:HlyD family secretion protein